MRATQEWWKQRKGQQVEFHLSTFKILLQECDKFIALALTPRMKLKPQAIYTYHQG